MGKGGEVLGITKRVMLLMTEVILVIEECMEIFYFRTNGSEMFRKPSYGRNELTQKQKLGLSVTLTQRCF